MEPESNHKVGSYVLDERLGTGATAEVYRAIQPGIERSVAIKVMHAHVASDPDFSARFQREAQAMGRLQHPHISRVIDFESDGEQAFMVMEFLAGGSLRDLMDRHGRLPVDYSVAITRQLADALDYAHSMGMVHRDIKPANVMFVDEKAQHALLTDFGMARLANEAMTMTGTMLGTPAYMAPEQVRGEGADHPADQYSLGVMLFELVTGQPPFVADSIHALMMKHATDEVPSARALNPAISEELDAVIATTMAKDPGARFKSSAALRDALDSVAGRSSVTAPTDTTPPGGATIIEPTPRLSTGPETVIASRERDAISSQHPRTGWSRPGKSKAKLGIAAIGVAAFAGLAIFVLTRSDGADVGTNGETAVEASDAADDNVSSPQFEPTTPAVDGETPEPVSDGVEAGGDEGVADAIVASRSNLVDLDAEAVPSFDPNTPPKFVVATARILEDRLLVAFGQVASPAPGHEFVAWFDTSPGPIGVLAVDDEGSARLEADAASVSTATQFVISEEPLGVEAPAPTGPVVRVTTLASDVAVRHRDLGEALAALEAQLEVAQDHQGFLADALAAGDLTEGRRHAEHVVNILDGEDGEGFGDLDGDGQAQNPGDGVGIRRYAAEIGGVGAQGGLVDDSITLASAELAQATVDALPSFVALAQSTGSGEAAAALAATDLAPVRELTLRLRAAVEREMVLRLLFEDTELLARRSGTAALSVGATAVHVTPSPLFSPVPDATPLVVLGDPTVSSNRVELDSHLTARVAVPEGAARFGQVSLFDGSGKRIAAGLLPSTAENWLDTLTRETDTLQGQMQLAIDHGALMQDAIAAGSHTETRRHAEHVINIIEGADGAAFGDLDGDGQAQNPGDGVGVLVYLNRLESVANAMPQNTDTQVLAQLRWMTMLDGIVSNAQDAVDGALRVIASDSVAEAEPSVEMIFDALVLARDGQDVDEGGEVDPLAGEGGITSLVSVGPTLISIELRPVG